MKYNDISPEIIANGIRVSPQTWHGHIGMKIEVYGCTEGNHRSVIFQKFFGLFFDTEATVELRK